MKCWMGFGMKNQFFGGSVVFGSIGSSHFVTASHVKAF